MTGPVKIQRDARGKRPRFYADPAIAAEGVDHVMSMVMVLAQELCVMRDRLDTVERICAAKGVVLADEIEAFHPDQATLEAREKRRQDMLGRLYYLARKDASEQATKDTAERYEKALEDIAAG
jgi:hypothetical protein